MGGTRGSDHGCAWIGAGAADRRGPMGGPGARGPDGLARGSAGGSQTVAYQIGGARI